MSKSQEIQKEITTRILADLQAGKLTWEKPFKTKLKGLPCSEASGKRYQGINFWNLFEVAEDRGFMVNRYMTYKQAEERGFQVKKGAQGIKVLFFRLLDKETETPDEKARSFPILSVSTVFNIGQIEGLEQRVLEECATRPAADVNAEAEEKLKRAGIATETHAAGSAYYVPSRDVVMMPSKQLFASGNAYLSTLAHEYVHSTGHPQRLGRTYGKKFGDAQYCREELIAEFGAAYLCAYLGVEYCTQHAAYVQSWAKGLTEKDVQECISKAQKAANWIIEKIEGAA